MSLFIDVVQRDFLEAFFWLAAFFGENNKLELQKYNGEHVCTVDVNYRHRNMTDRNVFPFHDAQLNGALSCELLSDLQEIQV